MRSVNVAVVGATGLVGQIFLKELDYNICVDRVKLFASADSVGKKIIFKYREYEILPLTKNCFDGMDFVFFSAGEEISKNWAKEAINSKAIVIDNSSYWRLNKQCPLIVPEINFEDFFSHRNSVIANPNCVTIQAALVLNVLKKMYGLNRVVISTYQSISGMGKNALDEYDHLLSTGDYSYFKDDLSSTCIPKIGEFKENGYTKEENKIISELKKILHLPELKVCPTCVRVPVLYSHGASITAFLDNKINIKYFKKELEKSEGIVLQDYIGYDIYPLQNYAKGKDEVFVGRIRKDLFDEKVVSFYCVSDNLRRGAAINATQIMNRIIDLE